MNVGESGRSPARLLGVRLMDYANMFKGNALVAAVDLHEDGPSPVLGLGGFPSLDYLHLIGVIDQNSHVRANGSELVSQCREIGDLVRSHGESIEDLQTH